MLHPEELDRRLNRHFSFRGQRYEGEGAYFAITAPDETLLAAYPKVELKHPETLKQK